MLRRFYPPSSLNPELIHQLLLMVSQRVQRAAHLCGLIRLFGQRFGYVTYPRHIAVDLFGNGTLLFGRADALSEA